MLQLDSNLKQTIYIDWGSLSTNHELVSQNSSECQIRDFAYIAYRHSTLFHYSMKQFPTVVKKKQIRESGQTSDRCLQFVFVKNHGNNYTHTIVPGVG